jgi:hypothetical protein
VSALPGARRSGLGKASLIHEAGVVVDEASRDVIVDVARSS